MLNCINNGKGINQMELMSLALAMEITNANNRGDSKWAKFLKGLFNK